MHSQGSLTFALVVWEARHEGVLGILAGGAFALLVAGVPAQHTRAPPAALHGAEGPRPDCRDGRPEGEEGGRRIDQASRALGVIKGGQT